MRGCPELSGLQRLKSYKVMRIMNRLNIFLFAIVVYSCKINKERQKSISIDTHRQAIVQSNSTAWQFGSQDSSYRYWYFNGDSGFYFHPDIGLWSRSGQIAYGEQRTVNTQAVRVGQTYDSIHTESNKVESQTHSKKSSYPLRGRLWLLAIIPIAVAIYWWCEKRK